MTAIHSGNDRVSSRPCLAATVIQQLLMILSLLIAASPGVQAATVKNGPSSSDSLVTAYSQAATGDTIQAQGVNFAEGLFLNRGITFTLRGGYDSAFSSNKGGYTTMNGPLVIASGRITVEKFILSGPNIQVTVPDVVGLTQTAAQNALSGANLTIGAAAYQYSDMLATGIVISQAPPASSSVDLGSPVTMIVSSGPAPPLLAQLDPVAGVQGTTFTVTFTGVHLATATAVVSDNPGVSGVITSVTDSSVVAAVTITPQAATGPTTLGLTTLGGSASLPFTVSTPLCVKPALGLVSWWRGEGNANDVTGLNNGAISSPAPTFVSGQVGQAFNFDGSSSVTIPNSSSLNPKQVTIEAWVKPDFTRTVTYTEIDTVFTKYDAALMGYGLYITHGQYFGVPRGTISFEGRAQTGPSGTPFPLGYFALYSSETVPNDGRFHHIAGTYDGSVVRVYLDGMLVGQSDLYSGDLQASPVSASIGVSTPFMVRYSSGALDEITLYNRALSESEIQAIYTAGTAGKCQDMGGVGPS